MIALIWSSRESSSAPDLDHCNVWENHRSKMRAFKTSSIPSPTFIIYKNPVEAFFSSSFLFLSRIRRGRRRQRERSESSRSSLSLVEREATTEAAFPTTTTQMCCCFLRRRRTLRPRKWAREREERALIHSLTVCMCGEGGGSGCGFAFLLFLGLKHNRKEPATVLYTELPRFNMARGPSPVGD